MTTLTHNKSRQRESTGGRNTFTEGGVWKYSQQASAPTASRELPGGREEDGSQVHRGLQGGLAYITVNVAAAPQTHTAGK